MAHGKKMFQLLGWTWAFWGSDPMVKLKDPPRGFLMTDAFMNLINLIPC